jgi:hypothetical protein
MPDNSNNRYSEIFAKIISVLFHPIFVPLYGLGILFTAPTFLVYTPYQFKKIIFLLVLMDNVMLPLVLIPFFRFRKIISSYIVEERAERVIPLIVTTILYFVTVFVFLSFPIPGLFKSFIFASAILVAVITLVNFWFKISIHAAGAGALIALVIVLSLKTRTPLMWYLMGITVLAGLILSSRLRLNVHDPAQVWTGFFAGVICSGLTIWLI